MPLILRKLLVGRTAAAHKFQSNVVSYNNAFAMASRRFTLEGIPGRGISFDRETCN